MPADRIHTHRIQRIDLRSFLDPTGHDQLFRRTRPQHRCNIHRKPRIVPSVSTCV